MSVEPTAKPICQNEIREHLLEFPKPAVTSTPTGLKAQTKYLWVLTLGVACIGGIAYLLSQWDESNRIWMVITVAILVILPSPLIIAISFQLWEWTQLRKLREMASGEYYVLWSITPVAWEKLVQERQQKNSQIPAIFAGIFGLMALVFVAMIYFDEETIFFGSTVFHFVLPTLGTAAIAYLCGLLCLWFAGMTDFIMRTHSPQLLVGPAGIYLTGTFWPHKTVGQKLVSVKVEKDEALLKCEYRISGKHGSRIVPIDFPYPENKSNTANCVAELLNRKS